jgi:hypothetical protein
MSRVLCETTNARLARFLFKSSQNPHFPDLAILRATGVPDGPGLGPMGWKAKDLLLHFIHKPNFVILSAAKDLLLL